MKTKEINKEGICIFIVLLLAILGIILNTPINKNDEITLLGETIKMYNGFHIYKDINILVTPLTFYIGLIIFKVFGANLLIFRLYGIAIWTFLFFNVYLVLKNLKISKNIIYISLLLLLIFLKDIITVGANYNTLAIALSVFGIYYVISKKERTYKYYLTQGIITFLIFMSKQNIGIYYALALLLCEIFAEKHKIKDIIINMILTATPVLLGVGIYCIYLYFDGALYNFIEYTFLGMKDFKQNLAIETPMFLLSFVNIILVAIVSYKEKGLDKNLKILFIFSMVMLLILYPIVCGFHTKMALIFSALSTIYIINSRLKSIKIIEYILITIGLIYLVISTIFNIQNWYKNYIRDKKDPYFGAVYTDLAEMNIKGMNDFMASSDKKVIIVSPDAICYNMRLNINNGILDYPVKGNVGINGYKKIIAKIQEYKNVKFLIKKTKYYQEYQEVHDYIKSNYENTGRIRKF